MLAGNILSIMCSLWPGQHCEATLKSHYGRIQQKKEGKESIWAAGPELLNNELKPHGDALFSSVLRARKHHKIVQSSTSTLNTQARGTPVNPSRDDHSGIKVMVTAAG